MKSQHWTDDHDLVELFASGSLNRERRNELEFHLSQCESCRDIVDREVLLRQGIRHYGRRNMKQRLRERLHQAAVPVIPWPHVLSAAAVLIIVVGIGIQTGWQQPGGPVLSDSEGGVADSTLGAEEIAPERSVPRAEDLQPAVEEPQGEIADEIAGIAAGEERRREVALGDARTSAPAAKSQSQSSSAILWVTGTILTETVSGESEKEERAFGARRQRAEIPAQVLSKDLTGPRMSVSQKPVRMLPQAQQLNPLGVQQVLAAVEERNDSLHLTIFTDENDFQFQELHVDAVIDDSVIVSGGRAKVGLRIPDALKSKIH